MTWDYLILTASNDQQAAAYRAELDVRRKLGLLQGFRSVLVVPDPEGRRVGSGGSTVCCLREVLSREMDDIGKDAPGGPWNDVLGRLRILIIHAGGDSRRLPAYGPCGKIFVPLPDRGESALGTTLLDRQLPIYRALPPAETGAGQVVITSGDVLLEFDPAEVCFAPQGVTGLGWATSPEQASRHGVFCPGPKGTVNRFLQKPTVAQQGEAGATDRYGQTILDVGVLCFDAATAVKLLELAGTCPAGGEPAWSGPVGEAIEAAGLDFYREVCCALGNETSLQSYLAAVRGAGSNWSEGQLGCLFNALSPIPFHVQVLSRCDFLHFGTSREIITSGLELLKRDNGRSTPQSYVNTNNHLDKELHPAPSDAWIEGCSIRNRLVLGGSNVVVGVDVLEPLSLPPRACLDILPGRTRDGQPVAFLRCYYVDDMLHQNEKEGASLCGRTISQWLDEVHALPEDVWADDLPVGQRGTWNARLFPAMARPTDYHRWLWMLEPEETGPDRLAAWKAADRYSLEEMALLADRELFQRRRLELRSGRLQRSLRRCFRGESGFSAADLAYLLAAVPDPKTLVKELLAEARWHLDREEEPPPHEAFAFARVVHTVGSAVEQLADGPGRASLQGLPGLAESLGPDVVTKPGQDDRDDTAEDVANWAGAARSAAFSYLQRTIVGSGAGHGSPPRNALRSDEIVWGRAPVRLDLTGGWTDTPPYSLEHGGCVLNAAVDLNGQPPIQVYARVTREPRIRLRSIDVGSDVSVCEWDELLDYGSVMGEFALAKAALVISGFSPASSPAFAGKSLKESLEAFGGGIELTSLAAVPKGSGLGTSSIMGAVLLAVIHRVLGQEPTATELFHGVLRLEQVLTTGGGWQDQIGGSVGGLKLITTEAGLVPVAVVRYFPADVLDPGTNGAQTLLYYTGITRLAKNILEEVVGRYLDRDREAMAVLQGLPGLAQRMADAIGRKDLPEFGRLIDRAWEANKTLDPNCTNEEVDRLLAQVRPHIYGAKLLGAGGGGFLLMVCKSAEDKQQVRQLLETNPPNDRARFFHFSVSDRGLEVSVC